MDKDDVVKMMSYLNNPMITKIEFEEDDDDILNFKDNESNCNEYIQDNLNHQHQKSFTHPSIKQNNHQANARTENIVKSHGTLVKYLENKKFNNNNNEVSYNQNNTNYVASNSKEQSSPNSHLALQQNPTKRKRPNESEDHTNASISTNQDIQISSLKRLASEHLLHIIKYNRRYSKQWSNLFSVEYLEQINRKKHLVKLYFFKISYSITLMILIPQENNEYFIRNFIEETVKLSQSMNVKTSFNEVSTLCLEMLTWTKTEKRVVNQSLERLTQMDNIIHHLAFSNNIIPTQPFGVPQVTSQQQGMSYEVNQMNPNINLQTSYRNHVRHIQSMTNCSQQITSFKQSWEQQEQMVQQNKPKFQDDQTFDERYSVPTNSRSMSRDSGIASPCSNLEQKTPEVQDGTDSMFNPQIVKVSSNNAAFMGQKKNTFAKQCPCHVCSKITTKMCLGCFSVFYCSVECQKKNYHEHKYVCKRRN